MPDGLSRVSTAERRDFYGFSHRSARMASQILVRSQFFSVPQGYVRFITVFGKFVRAVEPGLGSCLSLWGLYQRAGILIPIKEQVTEYAKESVTTKDGVNCLIDTVVFYSVADAMKAVFAVENYHGAIRNLVQAILRNQCGTLSARELLAAREQIANNIRILLDKDTAPWGIRIRLAEIKEIQFESQNK